MTGPTASTGVVTANRAFLVAMACNHRRVHIQSYPLQLFDLTEKPAIRLGLNSFVAQHIKAPEQAQNGLVSGGFGPAEQAGQGIVHAHHLGMSKPAASTPDRHDKLLDQLRRVIASIGARRGQIPARDSLSKLQAVQHPLQ